jgi:hypothetical protein
VAGLDIPEKYRQGVFEISQLDDRSVQAIRKVLDTVTMTSEYRYNAVISAISSLDQGNEAIGEAIGALYGVRVANEVPLEEFVNDIIESMDSKSQWQIPDDKREGFRRNLHSVLGAESFSLRAKVFDLQTEDERTFCCTRILTDLRPVFGSNVADGPKGMVVVHLLKLGFYRGGSKRQHEEIYVSLDAEDLETLRTVIERASSKAKTLRSVVPKLPVFGAAKE